MITIEQVQELYDLLLGEKLPAGCIVPESGLPNLSCSVADTIIWYLQAVLHVIPENFEQCGECDAIYDTNCSGYCEKVIAAEEGNQMVFTTMARPLCEECVLPPRHCEGCMRYCDADVPLDNDDRCPFCVTGKGENERVLASELPWRKVKVKT